MRVPYIVLAYRMAVDRRDTCGGLSFANSVRTPFLRSVLLPVMETARALPTAVILLVAGMVSLGAAVTGSLYLWRLAAPSILYCNGWSNCRAAVPLSPRSRASVSSRSMSSPPRGHRGMTGSKYAA